jgi:hypothetical protein
VNFLRVSELFASDSGMLQMTV